jgi:ribose 5-phosphate isomerase RpiB
MPFGEILYNIAIFLFAFMTFLIVRNYFRSKFDDEGRRIDMLDEYEKKDSSEEQSKD